MWTRCGLINLFPGRWHLHMRNDFVFEFPRPAMPNMVYTGGFRSLFRVLGSAGSSSWPLEHWWESFLGMSRRRSPRPLLSCLRSCSGTWDEAPSASATTRYWSTGCHRTTCAHIPKLEFLSPMEALMGSRRQFSMTTCPDSEQREELWFWTSPRWIGTCSQMPWRGLVTIPLIGTAKNQNFWMKFLKFKAQLEITSKLYRSYETCDTVVSLYLPLQWIRIHPSLVIAMWSCIWFCQRTVSTRGETMVSSSRMLRSQHKKKIRN